MSAPGDRGRGTNPEAVSFGSKYRVPYRRRLPQKMVLPTGFEPVIFHVRGGCPGPLDDGSMNEEKEVVGEVGFEPTSV